MCKLPHEIQKLPQECVLLPELPSILYLEKTVGTIMYYLTL